MGITQQASKQVIEQKNNYANKQKNEVFYFSQLTNRFCSYYYIILTVSKGLLNIVTLDKYLFFIRASIWGRVEGKI